MTFQELIEEIISLPGCFVLFDDGEDEISDDVDVELVFLDFIKEKEKADKVYSVFIKSKKNSYEMISEAKLLLENGYFSRAVTLAIMAYEELGKSQIAADFYSGMLPESKYKQAFKQHRKTAYANRYAAIGSHEKVKHGYYVDNSVAKTLETIRQSALYVDENNDPLINFSKEDASLIIGKVEQHQEAIQRAEYFNERIGSKALFR